MKSGAKHSHDVVFKQCDIVRSLGMLCRFLSHFKVFVLFAIIGCIAPSVIQAQEVLRGLNVNPEILKFNQDKKKSKQLKSALALPDSIELPFVDDFSTTSIYPDSKLWLDKKVFINSTFPVNPKTIGVATFDALDENGYLYKNASPDPFGADTLTSRPFNFKGQNLDSMYFSFYYQAQGIGDRPEPTDTILNTGGDSIMVDFYNPDLHRWKKVWPDTLRKDTLAWARGNRVTPFYQVIFKVEDEYKKDGFQFRFRNKASIDASQFAGKHGNVDHWNIDYVKLNKGRTIGDTVLNDIAFVKPISSLLKTYQSAPWRHYRPISYKLMKPTLDLTFRNNVDTQRFIHRYYSVSEVTKDNSGTYVFVDGLENVIPAYTTQTFPIDIHSGDVYRANEGSDTIKTKLFNVKAYISGTADDRRENDTVRYTQVFSNYYAYDDGTSEAGYGIYGEGAETAQVAYQFTPYMRDTLTGISFYFNPTEKDTTTNFPFKLAVWKDNKGMPGDFFYIENNDALLTPKKLMLNQFFNFKLDSGIIVSDKFYVGFVQKSDDFLNIGFDLNNNNQNFLWVNYNGTWTKSTIAGSLMIRPIFGKNMKEGPVTGTKNIKNQPFTVYPNPADNILYISTDNNANNKALSASLYDISGKLALKSMLFVNSIDISSLSNGFYILKLAGENINFQPVKILIQR